MKIIYFCKDLVERGIGWLVHNTAPRVLGWLLCIFLLLFGTVTAFFIPGWLDWINLYGVVITICGFSFTIYQLFKTLDTKETQKRTIEFERARHYRYCLDKAKSKLEWIKRHKLKNEWTLAIARIEDLIDLLRYIQTTFPQADDRWKQYARVFADFSRDFEEATNARTHIYDFASWNQIETEVTEAIYGELAPFDTEGGI